MKNMFLGQFFMKNSKIYFAALEKISELNAGHVKFWWFTEEALMSLIEKKRSFPLQKQHQSGKKPENRILVTEEY